VKAPCCSGGEGRSRSLARRLFGAAASVTPGAALVLLPKCPLCLAAWLTVATGVGVSAAAAAWMQETIVAVSIAALAGVAAHTIRRAVFRSAGPSAGSRKNAVSEQ
jgi:hypothetical protein